MCESEELYLCLCAKRDRREQTEDLRDIMDYLNIHIVKDVI